MKHYILRLDDACPPMDWEKWEKVEGILMRYHIAPIVGVIPDNKDPEFCHKPQSDFWEQVMRWKEAGWTIAQHGLEHVFSEMEDRALFQKSHRTTSEFAGKSYEEQKRMLKKGFDIMKSNGVAPVCFFAPGHTFDVTTVNAINDLGCYKFISDGYALHPFIKQEMLFLPAMFNMPRAFRNGVFTFVYHPNNMNEHDFSYLERFMKKYSSYFVNAEEYLEKYGVTNGQYDSQGVTGKLMEYGFYMLRGIQGILPNFTHRF